MHKSSWRDNTQRAESSYFADIMRVLNQFGLDPVQLIGKSEFIEAWARQAAERMVTGQLAANARSWREAASEGMRGRLIYRALRRELSGPIGARVEELVESNARLIRSLPNEVAALVAARAAERYAGGGRSLEFSRDKLMARVSRVRARLIARTEVSKASTALTQARAEDLELLWYVWRTSEDSRVRASHRKMDNVLFRWNDPPSPESLIGARSYGHYAPGNIFNCRCYPEPLLSLGQIAWPHRCYINGIIRYLTLAQFRRLNHLPSGDAIGIAA